MRIVKGVLLGIGLSLVGTILYVLAMMSASGARAAGSTAIEAWTVWNPLYWLALVAMIAIGCLIVRKWPVKTM